MTTMTAGVSPTTSPPFSFFVSLLREISRHCHPNNKSKHAALPRTIFTKWIARLRSEFGAPPEGTTAIIFRLLFPEEDSRRKYDMQETRLASAVAECFGTSAKPLLQWQTNPKSGCLGSEVLKVLAGSTSYDADYIGPLSVAEVDNLLNELSSHSTFSDSSIRAQHPHATRRPRTAIMRLLYCSMAPIEAAYLTQIILKDLRPLLYPLTESHYTAALKSYNSTSITLLTKEDAMRAWDPSLQMLHLYRVRSRLDDAATAFETGATDATPQIGTPVEIPKSEKGRGCLHALEMLRSSKEVWAETKYDGERAQIHVRIRPNSRPHITIFSKSKRDSTWDRFGIHTVICDSLGLTEASSSKNEGPARRMTCNVILDAEMVAWHGDKIDEFWRIGSLVEHTARGARRIDRAHENENVYTQTSLMTDVSDVRHLGLVYFDILLLDSASLLSLPYSSRRSILESVIKPIPNRVIFADRKPIAMNSCPSDPTLHRVFAECLAAAQEGLVVKATESTYNDPHLPWVKLKKDYIPGYGDCLDLVVLGVGWDKERARELRVAPDAYTTFYIGGLHNQEQMKQDPKAFPHFHIYFTASYGLSRDQLEEANFLIKSSDTIPGHLSKPPPDLPFTYSILPGLSPPVLILRKPLLCELFGAGFTKSPKSRHYELRFPRITKLYRTGERSWREAVTLQALHQVARECIGRDRANKDLDDWGNQLWNKPISPVAAVKRRRKADEWEEKLIASDRKSAKKKGLTLRVFGGQPANVSHTHGPIENRIHSDAFRAPSLPSAARASDNLTPSRHRRPLVAYPSPQTSPLVSEQLAGSSLHERESFVRVLNESLVFLATRNPKLRRRWKALIPSDRVVHSLDSLFAGCGWDSGITSPSSVQQGLVLLAIDEPVAHRTCILDAIRERKASPHRKAILLLQRGAME